MAANTLYEYYTQQGKQLPSISERSQIYEQYGLGSASTYIGDINQNIALLKSLQSGVPTQSVAPQQTIEPAQPLRIEQPEVDYSYQNILDKITPDTRLAQIEEERNREIQRIEAQQQAAREEQKTLKDKLTDWVSGRKTEDVVRSEMDEWKVMETLDLQRQAFADIQELNQKAIGMIEARDAAIAALGQMTIATPFITGQQARVAEAYDRRISSMSALIGAKSAYAEALSGNMNVARGFINDIVNAYTFDTKLEFDRITMFLDINRDEIRALDISYQNAFSESQRYWENRLNTEKEERRIIMELSLNYLGANINYDDKLEDAVKKAREFALTQPNEDVKKLMMAYPQAGIKTTDDLETAVRKVSALPAEGGKWETRTIGNNLYRVNAITGEVEPLLEGGNVDQNEIERWADMVEQGLLYERVKDVDGKNITTIRWDKMPTNIRPYVSEELERRGLYDREEVVPQNWWTRLKQDVMDFFK